MNYDKAKRRAADQTESTRRKVAARKDAQPEILYYLAEDESPEVRRVTAANPATPRQADLLLARDRDDEVRVELAHKIGRLAPELSPTQLTHLQRLTLQALELLAQDQLPRVRQIIAEEIKNLDNVPSHLVSRLARDVKLVVCAPVLEFSPLLSDVDLIEIIESAPVQGALNAISRRRRVASKVADAIVSSDLTDAVAELLANSSAQIREETLDRIIDKAPRHEAWHEPLVNRPTLSHRAVHRIAQFVTASLLAVLEKRHDVDPHTTTKVAKAVSRRMSADGLNEDGLPENRVRKMLKEGTLDEASITAALTRGDRPFVAHALALKSELSLDLVQKVLNSNSGKMVTALCWKARLSMRGALDVQLKGARISPTALVNAKDGIDYPFSPEEMETQLSFLAG